MQSTAGRLRVVLARVAVTVALVGMAVGASQALPWAGATTSSGDRAIYEPLAPARILDTRSPSTPLGPSESRVLQVTGSGGVPADATAVVVNVTAVAPTAGGWLTLYPADVPLPLASNLNFSTGQTVPNSVTVRLGSTVAELGRIKIFNSAGQTHVLVDVAGYYRGHTHDDRYHIKAQAQARLAANSLTCPAGSFLGSVAADGTPTCGAGAAGPPGPAGVTRVVATAATYADSFSNMDPAGTRVVVSSLSLPPGSWMVTATLTAYTVLPSSICEIGTAASAVTLDSKVAGAGLTPNYVPRQDISLAVPMSLQGVVSLSTTTVVQARCVRFGDSAAATPPFQVRGARMFAVQASTLEIQS